MRMLRPYQADAIQNLRDTLRQGVRRVVLQLPTGAGKTVIAGEIVSLAREKGNKVAFVCPAISLVDQTVESFYAQGIRDVGVQQASHHLTDYSKPVQVCSIQTIQARKYRPDCEIIIFDECHRVFQEHREWMLDPDWAKKPFIGLSATPWAKGLGKYFETLLKVSTTADMIAAGYLSPFKVFSGGHPDLSGVRTMAGDYNESDLSDAMQKGGLTADIVETYRQRWGQGKTLCFAVDRAHAKTIQERFIHVGVTCAYQDADTPQHERAEIKRRFQSGEIEVVTSVETMIMGIDYDVRCIICARPTKSDMLWCQLIGRGLRTAPGKEICTILDHSDNTLRLGFVTDIDRDRLDDGEPVKKSAIEKKEPLPKECKECAFLKPPKTKICPNCGHETKIRSEIMEADGVLVEITPGKKTKGKLRQEYTEAEQRTFFAELKAYALIKEYKPGWPAAKFRERFKAWPPRYFENIQPAKVVSPTVALWIRSRNIAFAKARAKNQESADAQ
jgi:superfamily II DNA or RNA helicase